MNCLPGRFTDLDNPEHHDETPNDPWPVAGKCSSGTCRSLVPDAQQFYI